MLSDKRFEISHAYLCIKTVSLLLRSRSSVKIKANIKVTHQKKAIAGAFMFYKHILFYILTLSQQALVFTYLRYKSLENTVGKGEIARNEQFHLFPQYFLPIWRDFCHFHQIFSSTGHRPASLCHGPLSVMRPSVYALTFSLNISKTTYRILMEFHRNVPTMVLFRIS